jgi:hypothetical protein
VAAVALARPGEVRLGPDVPQGRILLGLDVLGAERHVPRPRAGHDRDAAVVGRDHVAGWTRTRPSTIGTLTDSSGTRSFPVRECAPRDRIGQPTHGVSATPPSFRAEGKVQTLLALLKGCLGAGPTPRHHDL